jgi:formamidopyrimidine-DNA glycosylase
MPELPEVEIAVAVLRRALVGRTITAIDVRHAAHRRRLGTATAARLIGERVVGVERRGKHQLVRLASGATLHVHFRMAGDWAIDTADAPWPPSARLAITTDDGTRAVLTDPRALSTATWHPADVDPLPTLGPDAIDDALTAPRLAARLAGRRTPIKVALLDQRIVAGVGNIYAAEALWRARIDPRRQARSLSLPEVARLRRAIRAVMRAGLAAPGRYADGTTSRRFAVYDRAGAPCRRCRSPIARLTQAGRSTYWCPGCQRRTDRVARPVSRAPRRARP